MLFRSFRGPRPTCAVAVTECSYGETIAVTCPQADRLREFNLVRPGVTTHSSDNEQRLVDLPFRVSGPGAVDLDLPAKHALAPPGWYMLFAVDTAGVPSEASWLHLS